MSSLENALLGLVAMRPMSGYDVKRLFETTAMGQFSSSPGAIYPALKRLEQRGLLESDLDRPSAARPRRVYRITRDGEEQLDAWLRDAITTGLLRRDPTGPMLRYSLSEGRLDHEETLNWLRSFRSSMARHIDWLSATLDELDTSGAVRARHALQHGIASATATLTWLDERIDQCESGKGG